MRGRRRVIAELPSTTLWRVDGELHGHLPSETLQYLSDVADHADEIAERQRSGEDFVVATGEPRVFWRRFRWTW
jgi:hypothetical protein